MLNGCYLVDVIECGILCFDVVVEVVVIGSVVKDFVIGDYVLVNFDFGYFVVGDDELMQVFGGDVDGVLREYVVFEDKEFV